LSATEQTADERLVYADSSALVKLVVAEPESPALAEYLGEPLPRLLTSRIAVVEVMRAVRLGDGTAEASADAERLLGACDLVDLTAGLLRTAAGLTSAWVRSLDAVHLASVMRVDPDVVVVYDRRLAEAADAAGFVVVAPGA
jgi:predicted nucleic acid-binding protein